jgi:hypothetical protein
MVVAKIMSVWLTLEGRFTLDFGDLKSFPCTLLVTTCGRTLLLPSSIYSWRKSNVDTNHGCCFNYGE